MKLLAPPSRRPPDRGVSITGPSSSADAVARIAGRNGCPDRIQQKVADCVRHSGRYDCRIAIALAMPTIFDAFRAALARHGADAVLTD